MKPKYFTITGVLASLALILLALVAYVSVSPSPDPLEDLAEEAIPEGEPPIGGTFTLSDENGNPVTEADLLGQYHLIFFGFTNCIDVCPAMLNTMTWVYENLPQSKQDKLQMVFVSVDPMRDTKERMAEYVDAFHPDFVGWTGTTQQVDQMTKNYLAYYALPEGAASSTENYQVAHSAFLYLMGPEGEYVAHFRNSDSATSILEGLEELVE